MKTQKMEILSVGTDWDIVRSVGRSLIYTAVIFHPRSGCWGRGADVAGNVSRLDTFIKQLESRVSASI